MVFSTVVNVKKVALKKLFSVYTCFSDLEGMGNKGTRITFHEKLHGTNVALNKGGVVASRINRSSTTGTIAYVEQEIPKGVKVEIRVDEKYKQTEGSMVCLISVEHIDLGVNYSYAFV